MSNSLAIAAVTALLKDLLDNGVIDCSVTDQVGPVTVSALAPDQVVHNLESPSRLNLFLYHVTFNQGWRNSDLPAFNSGGSRISSPPLALDLHYMLTAYGQKEYQAEILLGYAMQLFHEHPGLTRDEIRMTLNGRQKPGGDPGLLDYPFNSSSTVELDRQLEAIKITPEPLSLEEVSRMWTATQRSYRPTVGYKVSVVLIESRRPTRRSLPVKSYGTYVYPFGNPVIDEATGQAKVTDDVVPGQPIMAGQRLAILGKNLQGNVTVVRVDNLYLSPLPKDLSDTCCIVQLPACLRAGMHAAQVVHELEIGDDHRQFVAAESNGVAFMLRPLIKSNFVAATNSSDRLIDGVSYHTRDLVITFTPAASKSQRVLLLLNHYPNAAYPAGQPGRSYCFQAPRDNGIANPSVEETDTITFSVTVPAGEYLLRVQIGGAESLLEQGTEGQYDTPRRVI